MLQYIIQKGVTDVDHYTPEFIAEISGVSAETNYRYERSNGGYL